MTAARVLLQRIVDYAGLFPPAGLSMQRAVANYAEYAAGPHAWMLGSFVVPAARLQEFEKCWDALPDHGRREPCDLSVLFGAEHEADAAKVARFMDRRPDIARVRSIEVKAATMDDLRALGILSDELPEIFLVFIEVPLDDSGPLISTIGRFGFCAKMRTGGVTAEAFPPAEGIVGFMRACMEAGAPFKATAGLHHPVRAEYSLTYEANAPRGRMFGFLNVFLAAALLSMRATDDEALMILNEQDARAFQFEAGTVRWRDVRFTLPMLEALRSRVAWSFGSCSFTEPVEGLAALGVDVEMGSASGSGRGSAT